MFQRANGIISQHLASPRLFEPLFFVIWHALPLFTCMMMGLIVIRVVLGIGSILTKNWTDFHDRSRWFQVFLLNCISKQLLSLWGKGIVQNLQVIEISDDRRENTGRTQMHNKKTSANCHDIRKVTKWSTWSFLCSNVDYGKPCICKLGSNILRDNKS